MVPSAASKYSKALDKVKALEDKLHAALIDVAKADRLVEDLRTELKIQVDETRTMGVASMEVRGEDAQQLADYKATNTELIELIEKVANGRSKLRGEARALLGLDN